MRTVYAIRSAAFSMWSGILLAFIATASLSGQQSGQAERKQIGEVLGQAVYQDEIRTGKDVRLRDELHRLFATPVMEFLEPEWLQTP